MSSTTPDAIRALHELLERVDWPLRPPQITLGPTRELDREVVMLADVNGDQEWAQVGARRRDEDYTVDLFVLVAWPGHTALDALDRAWELFAAIEDALRDPENVALARSAGVLWNEIKSPSSQPTVEDEGHGHVIQSAVRFRARI